jgi:hypothetical protein
MRNTVRIFKDIELNRIHFLKGKLGMEIGFDMWISIPKGPEFVFFDWLEIIIKTNYNANNLTDISFIQKDGQCELLELTFNITGPSNII